MATIRIFVSSPGDVGREREICRKVMERVDASFRGRVSLAPYFWEHEPMLSTRGDFQEQIPDTATFDLVVCILWSRLGSRLHPGKHQRADGTPYSSGTEYEFESAALSRLANGKPELLVYRRATLPQAPLHPPEEIEARLSQYRALTEFWERWFMEGKSFKLAYNSYGDGADFETMFEEHLRALVERWLAERGENAGTAGAGRARRWHEDPYRGLKVFEFEHEPVFFGRTRARDEVLSILQRRYFEEKCPFILLLGASGSGKSSLMRAGILPWLVREGVIQGGALWRRALVMPSGAGKGALLEHLVACLVAPEALPELLLDGSTVGELAEMIRREPAAAAGLVKGALGQVAAAVARERDLVGMPAMRLALAIDQMEEVFTLEDKIDKEARDRFFRVVGALARSGLVWIVATMRSDFYHHCQDSPELVELKAGLGHYDLLAPTPAELSQMIRYPAEAVGMLFEDDPLRGKLNEVIAGEAMDQAGALPLLEYALESLYERAGKAGLLTHAAYDGIGRVQGSVAVLAEQAYQGLEEEEKRALPAVLRALVTLGDGEEDIPVRRVALAEVVERQPGARGLLARFCSERLFLADVDADGRRTVTVAHEALLRAWGRVGEWVESNRTLLRARRRVARAAALWEQNTRHEDYLLAAGLPLGEASQLLAAHPEELEPLEVALISHSQVKRDAAETRARRTWRLAFAALGGLALVAVVAAAGAAMGWKEAAENSARAAGSARNAAERAREAGLERDKALRQSERSQFEEGRAWLERARLSRKSGDAYTALYQAGRAIGFHGYGRGTAPAGADIPPLLGRPVGEPLLEERRQRVAAEVREFLDESGPSMMPLWSSPITRQHAGGVEQVVYGAGGKILATVGGGEVKLWDVATASKVITLGAGATLKCMALSPDGRRVAAAGFGKTVCVWDAATGARLADLEGYSSTARCMDYSPDGNYLAAGWENGLISVWDAGTGEMVESIPADRKTVTCLRYLGPGRILAGYYDGTLLIRDLAKQEEGGIAFQAHRYPVDCLDLMAGGRMAASASVGGEIRIWDLLTGEQVGPDLHLPNPNGNMRAVSTLACSPDGKRIVCATLGIYEEHLRLWDVETATQLAEVAGGWGGITSLAYSRDGKVIVCGTGSGQVELRDGSLEHPLSRQAGHMAAVNAVAYHPDGGTVASGSADGTVMLWSLETGEALHVLDGHGDAVKRVAYSPDGSVIASGADDGSVGIWDASTGEEIRMLRDSAGKLTGLAFSPDGKWIASGEDDGTLRLRAVATRDAGPALPGLDSAVAGVCFSPDGMKLAVGSVNGEIRWLDPGTGKEIWKSGEGKSSGNQGVRDLAFRPDGKVMATAHQDGVIRFWTGTEEAPPADLVADLAGGGGLSYSPDGTRLAWGMRIWDLASPGRDGVRLPSFGNRVPECVAFSPDGTRLASGDTDGAVRIWEVARDARLRTLESDARSLDGQAFAPGGERLAAAADPNRILLWNLESGKLLGEIPAKVEMRDSLVFSPDGRWLAVPSWEEVSILDSLSGKERTRVEGLRDGPDGLGGNPDAMAFSPDGGRIALGSLGGGLVIADAGSGKIVSRLLGSEESLRSVAFHPDGARVASWSVSSPLPPDSPRRWEAMRSRLSIWSAETGEELFPAVEKGDDTAEVAFSGDGRTVSATMDGRVLRWDLETMARLPDVKVPVKAVWPAVLSPEGDQVASARDGVISIRSTESLERNLAAPYLAGMVVPVDDSIVMKRASDSLIQPLVFAPLGGEAVAPARRAEIRLMRLAAGSRWRAASHWWQGGGKADHPELERMYLSLLLTSAVDPVATLPADAGHLLLRETVPLLSAEHLAHPLVGVGLPGLVVRGISRPAGVTGELWDGFLEAVVKNAPADLRDGIAERLAAERLKKDISPEGKVLLERAVARLFQAGPDSPALMKAALEGYDAGDARRMALEDRYFSLPEAQADYVARAAYDAADRGDLDRARKIMEVARGRFSGPELQEELFGWTFIHLKDYPAAIKIFQSFAPLEDPGYADHRNIYQLVGLALAQWLGGSRPQAISTYQVLIGRGYLLSPPYQWDKASWLAETGFLPAEKKVLEEIRAAAVAEEGEEVPSEQ